MEESKKMLITEEGLRKLEEELHHRKVVLRKEISGKIQEAREQGDLSENAEYDAARDEQRDNESKIEELENYIKNAEVIVVSDMDKDKINVSSTVKVFDKEYGEELEFTIVGSKEVNSLEGKISLESPIGKELLGKRKGDVVEVEMNGHPMIYEIIDVTRKD